MIETKHGDPHPDTGIPPSFATIKSETIVGKNRQFFIEMGRPTKIHLSLSRLNQLCDIRKKVFHDKYVTYLRTFFGNSILYFTRYSHVLSTMMLCKYL